MGLRSNNWCVYKRKEKDLDIERHTGMEETERHNHTEERPSEDVGRLE